ncbi:ADP-ribosylglycohydrolase family protein [Gandjariella thermophila]|uniref:ADP-ribosylglycohydrolase family protein n=1 Tax=Gandjariella thermophila TaxID=1931992 RepID=UPI001CEF7069|nr:ADP-ribosylglycohydrolase family protein [Gandjariella thermophila]
MTDGWKPSKEDLEAIEILEKFHEERKKNPVEEISLPPGQDFLIGYDSKGRKLYVDDDKEEGPAGEFSRPRSASDRPSARASTTAVPYRDRVLGSLLAGAVGDALGAPVEGLPMENIRQLYGPEGITEFKPAFGVGPGLITDDTQMTLFTLEGLIRAHVKQRNFGTVDVPAVVHRAYLRWLRTQTPPPKTEPTYLPGDGWLITNRALHRRRAPGRTCMTALRATRDGEQFGTFEHRLNDSKGNGGVMRAAPVALWPGDVREVFELAARTAAITHSHPSGYLSAGTLAVIVHQLLAGADLRAAIATAHSILLRWDGHEEQARALDAAIDLASAGRPTPEQIAERLGGGWVGEEALAIGVCAALCTDNLTDALIVAVNHSGDSDSTGAVCGNIVGAHYGPAAIPESWLATLELRDVIETITRDAVREFGPEPPSTPDWYQRYPGW